MIYSKYITTQSPNHSRVGGRNVYLFEISVGNYDVAKTRVSLHTGLLGDKISGVIFPGAQLSLKYVFRDRLGNVKSAAQVDSVKMSFQLSSPEGFFGPREAIIGKTTTRSTDWYMPVTPQFVGA